MDLDHYKCQRIMKHVQLSPGCRPCCPPPPFTAPFRPPWKGCLYVSTISPIQSLGGASSLGTRLGRRQLLRLKEPRYCYSTLLASLLGHSAHTAGGTNLTIWRRNGGRDISYHCGMRNLWGKETTIKCNFYCRMLLPRHPKPGGGFIQPAGVAVWFLISLL